MRLKEIRKENKFSQAELAQKIGVSRSTISMWEIGASQPDNDSLILLSKLLNVSVDRLLDNDNAEMSTSKNVLPIKTKKVPLLGSIACGEPIFANEEHGEFVLTSDNIDADFCLRAKGDSMIEARIHDGDVVFVKRQDIVQNGQIAVVIIGDEATLKYWDYDAGRQRLILSPANRNYRVQIYEGEELETIHCLGRAVCFMGKL